MRGQSPRSLISRSCFEKLGNEGTVPSFPISGALDQAYRIETESGLAKVLIDFAALLQEQLDLFNPNAPVHFLQLL